MPEVNSTDSLGNLRLRIFQQTGVAPVAQLLMYGDAHLTDNNATLESLGIMPDKAIRMVGEKGGFDTADAFGTTSYYAHLLLSVSLGSRLLIEI